MEETKLALANEIVKGMQFSSYTSFERTASTYNQLLKTKFKKEGDPSDPAAAADTEITVWQDTRPYEGPRTLVNSGGEIRGTPDYNDYSGS